MKKVFNTVKYCKRAKKLLFLDPKLSLFYKNAKEVSETDNQFLYLYPLNIIDYYNAWHLNRIIKLSIKNFRIDDIPKIKKTISESLIYKIFLVEIEIKNILTDEEWQTFNSFTKYLKEKGFLITLKIKDIGYVDNSKIIFDKMDTIIISTMRVNSIYNNNFFKHLKQAKKKHQCVIIKIYLNTQDFNEYENIVLFLKNSNCDYVIFSKILMPTNIKRNIQIDAEVAIKLKEIMSKYNNGGFGVKVVKDVSTLYYDRFIIHEKNSHTCFVSKISYFYQNGKLFPCSSEQIISNDINYCNTLKNVKNYIENSCSDCAYIFENDYLNSIYLKQPRKLKFEISQETNQIPRPIGVGSFKLDNSNNLYTNIIFGQNLIDCNMAYKSGTTCNNIAKALSKFDRCKYLIYAKLYRRVDSKKDIDAQINEYLSLFQTTYIDILTIHSLNIVGDYTLKDIYVYLMKLRKKGIIKQLGVANISTDQLNELLKAKIKIEFFEGPYNLINRYYEKSGLINICKQNHIKYITYQSLCFLNNINSKTFEKLIKKYNKSIHQILLNYYINHKGFIVLVKSTSKKHIVSNNCFDFFMDDKDYKHIENLFNDINDYAVEFVPQSQNPIYTLTYRLLTQEYKKD